MQDKLRFISIEIIKRIRIGTTGHHKHKCDDEDPMPDSETRHQIDETRIILDFTPIQSCQNA